MPSDQLSSSGGRVTVDVVPRSRTIRRVMPWLVMAVIPGLQFLQSMAALSTLPAFWRFYADPPYMYLFNSLNLGSGLTPQHVDHPGTSLQWLMAGVEHGTFLLIGADSSLPSDIASNPEKYLTATGIVLGALFAASVAFFNWRILHSFGAFPALIAGGLILGASGLTVPWMVTATPEALVGSSTLISLGLLAPSLATRLIQPNWRILIILGVFLGIGLTAKITMLPLLVLLLFTLQIRRLLTVAAVTVGAAALILIPVYELLPRMFGWFTNLARSSGRYGGESASSVPENIQAGLATVTREYSVVWLVLGLFVLIFAVTLVGGGWNIDWSTRWPAMGIAASVVATVAVSFKESTDRDFVLLVGLIPALAAITSSWIQRGLETTQGTRGATVRILAAATVVTVSLLVLVANYRSFAEIQTTKERSDAEVQLLKRASQRDGSVAHSFLAQNEFFALMLGSEWAYHPYSDRILDRFPNNLYYNAFLSTVFGVRQDGTVGYLDCRDLESLISDEGLTFVLPGDFGPTGEREFPGEIRLADGSRLTFDPKSVDLFEDRLSTVPIERCIPAD